MVSLEAQPAHKPTGYRFIIRIWWLTTQIKASMGLQCAASRIVKNCHVIVTCGFTVTIRFTWSIVNNFTRTIP
jgi:hypothetical protein